MSDEPVVGGDILRLITAGMYDNPLVLYREYLQNAADAIASRGDARGSVHISIDPLKAQVTISDDGTGLSPPRSRPSPRPDWQQHQDPRYRPWASGYRSTVFPCFR